jgi:hypothetical protein
MRKSYIIKDKNALIKLNTLQDALNRSATETINMALDALFITTDWEQIQKDREIIKQFIQRSTL